MRFFKIIPFLLLLFTFQLATAENYHRTRISELDFKQESDELREALSERLFPGPIDKRINIRTDAESHLAWPKTDDDAGNPKIQGEHVAVFRLENEEPIEGFI